MTPHALSQRRRNISYTPRLNNNGTVKGQQLNSNTIASIGYDLDFKLCKLKEMSQSDKELIEMQRKALFLQKIEFQQLENNNESLQRNFDLLSKNLNREMNEKQ